MLNVLFSSCTERKQINRKTSEILFLYPVYKLNKKLCRGGFFQIQTSRQTQTGHDGTNPADALRRTTKLVLESHKEDPKTLQCSHYEDIYLQTHTNGRDEISASRDLI